MTIWAEARERPVWLIELLVCVNDMLRNIFAPFREWDTVSTHWIIRGYFVKLMNVAFKDKVTEIAIRLGKCGVPGHLILVILSPHEVLTTSVTYLTRAKDSQKRGILFSLTTKELYETNRSKQSIQN